MNAVREAPIRVLLVEDNRGDARLLEEILADAAPGGFQVTHVESLKAALNSVSSAGFDAILLDLSLPDSRGLATVRKVHECTATLPILVLTGLDDESLGIEAVRLGAQDYLVKGHVDARLLSRAIWYAIERKRAEEELKALNETLEERVAERTAVAEQRARQLRALAAELAQTEQRERRRLAELLHDHLQQLLIGAKYNVAVLRGGTRDPSLQAAASQVEDLLDDAVKASRTLTVELSPPVLYDSGLAAALDWLARWMQEKHGLTVEVAAEPEAEPEAEDLRAMLFHAVRELLLNVVKHAGVRRAEVRLTRTADGHVQVLVTDAGQGFDTAQLWRAGTGGTGFGLFSIRERIEMLSGRFDVTSRPGQGTQVTLQVPVEG